MPGQYCEEIMVSWALITKKNVRNYKCTIFQFAVHLSTSYLICKTTMGFPIIDCQSKVY